MDLNVGSVLWFAAGGTGYVRDYSAEEAELVYQECVAVDRPALRVGGARVDGISGPSEGSSGAGGAEPGGWSGGAPRCGNVPACGRVAKKGCARGLCARCCRRADEGGRGLAAPCHVHRSKGAVDKVGLVKGVVTAGTDAGDESATGADRTLYCSTARVLLVGVGADELLAGYGRHRTRYREGGAEAVERELRVDRERLWLRNLGR